MCISGLADQTANERPMNSMLLLGLRQYSRRLVQTAHMGWFLALYSLSVSIHASGGQESAPVCSR